MPYEKGKSQYFFFILLTNDMNFLPQQIFTISSPLSFERDVSKSPYLTAHLKINYEPGRISEKVQTLIQDRHNV